jgi:hypothetical protein
MAPARILRVIASMLCKLWPSQLLVVDCSGVLAVHHRASSRGAASTHVFRRLQHCGPSNSVDCVLFAAQRDFYHQLKHPNKQLTCPECEQAGGVAGDGWNTDIHTAHCLGKMIFVVYARYKHEKCPARKCLGQSLATVARASGSPAKSSKLGAPTWHTVVAGMCNGGMGQQCYC